MDNMEGEKLPPIDTEEHFFSELGFVRVCDEFKGLGYNRLLAVGSRSGVVFWANGQDVFWSNTSQIVTAIRAKSTSADDFKEIATSQTSTVVLLALSPDESILTIVEQNGEINLHSVHDLINSEGTPLESVEVPSTPKSFQWTETGSFWCLLENGDVCEGGLGKELRILANKVEAFGISPKGNMCGVCLKAELDTLVVQCSGQQAKIKLQYGDPDSPVLQDRESLVIHSICWVNEQQAIVGCTLIADHEEENSSVLMFVEVARGLKQYTVDMISVESGLYGEGAGPYLHHCHVNEWEIALCAHSKANDMHFRAIQCGESLGLLEFPDNWDVSIPLCLGTDDDNYVLGAGFDFTATQLDVKWTVNEVEKTLPPCPVLIVATTDGCIRAYTFGFLGMKSRPTVVHDCIPIAEIKPITPRQDAPIMRLENAFPEAYSTPGQSSPQDPPLETPEGSEQATPVQGVPASVRTDVSLQDSAMESPYPTSIPDSIDGGQYDGGEYVHAPPRYENDDDELRRSEDGGSSGTVHESATESDGAELNIEDQTGDQEGDESGEEVDLVQRGGGNEQEVAQNSVKDEVSAQKDDTKALSQEDGGEDGNLETSDREKDREEDGSKPEESEGSSSVNQDAPGTGCKSEETDVPVSDMEQRKALSGDTSPPVDGQAGVSGETTSKVSDPGSVRLEHPPGLGLEDGGHAEEVGENQEESGRNLEAESEASESKVDSRPFSMAEKMGRSTQEGRMVDVPEASSSENSAKPKTMAEKIFGGRFSRAEEGETTDDVQQAQTSSLSVAPRKGQPDEKEEGVGGECGLEIVSSSNASSASVQQPVKPVLEQEDEEEDDDGDVDGQHGDSSEESVVGPSAKEASAESVQENTPGEVDSLKQKAASLSDLQSAGGSVFGSKANSSSAPTFGEFTNQASSSFPPPLPGRMPSGSKVSGAPDEQSVDRGFVMHKAGHSAKAKSMSNLEAGGAMKGPSMDMCENPLYGISSLESSPKPSISKKVAQEIDRAKEGGMKQRETKAPKPAKSASESNIVGLGKQPGEEASVTGPFPFGQKLGSAQEAGEKLDNREVTGGDGVAGTSGNLSETGEVVEDEVEGELDWIKKVAQLHQEAKKEHDDNFKAVQEMVSTFKSLKSRALAMARRVEQVKQARKRQEVSPEIRAKVEQIKQTHKQFSLGLATMEALEATFSSTRHSKSPYAEKHGQSSYHVVMEVLGTIRKIAMRLNDRIAQLKVQAEEQQRAQERANGRNEYGPRGRKFNRSLHVPQCAVLSPFSGPGGEVRRKRLHNFLTENFEDGPRVTYAPGMAPRAPKPYKRHTPYFNEELDVPLDPPPKPPSKLSVPVLTVAQPPPAPETKTVAKTVTKAPPTKAEGSGKGAMFGSTSTVAGSSNALSKAQEKDSGESIGKDKKPGDKGFGSPMGSPPSTAFTKDDASGGGAFGSILTGGGQGAATKSTTGTGVFGNTSVHPGFGKPAKPTHSVGIIVSQGMAAPVASSNMVGLFASAPPVTTAPSQTLQLGTVVPTTATQSVAVSVPASTTGAPTGGMLSSLSLGSVGAQSDAQSKPQAQSGRGGPFSMPSPQQATPSPTPLVQPNQPTTQAPQSLPLSQLSSPVSNMGQSQFGGGGGGLGPSSSGPGTIGGVFSGFASQHQNAFQKQAQPAFAQTPPQSPQLPQNPQPMGGGGFGQGGAGQTPIGQFGAPSVLGAGGIASQLGTLGQTQSTPFGGGSQGGGFGALARNAGTGPIGFAALASGGGGFGGVAAQGGNSGWGQGPGFGNQGQGIFPGGPQTNKMWEPRK